MLDVGSNCRHNRSTSVQRSGFRIVPPTEVSVGCRVRVCDDRRTFTSIRFDIFESQFSAEEVDGQHGLTSTSGVPKYSDSIGPDETRTPTKSY